MLNHRTPSRKRQEAGYALLMAVFLVATMILLAAAIVPDVVTEGRREMEKETIWRGEQYERAIGRYYRTTGGYPSKVEDLTRLTNETRFLRRAYLDPMNKEDGSWRFIYLNPATGQLIGSVRGTSWLQAGLNMSLVGSSPALGGGLAPLAPPAAPGSGTTAGPGSGLTGTAGLAGASGPGLAGQQANPAATPNPLESQPQALQGPVIGGILVGVGSKIKKPSYRLYLGGDTYEQWEFIWNPVHQAPGVPGQNPATPGQGIAPAFTPPPNAYPQVPTVPPGAPVPPNFPQQNPTSPPGTIGNFPLQ